MHVKKRPISLSQIARCRPSVTTVVKLECFEYNRLRKYIGYGTFFADFTSVRGRRKSFFHNRMTFLLLFISLLLYSFFFSQPL